MHTNLISFYKNKNVLVTGGAGFIGSNLTMALVDLGAHVAIVDCFMPEFGANEFNYSKISSQIKIHHEDIRNQEAMKKIVKDQEIIFHLAGLNDHVAALKNPFPDLEVNIIGTTHLLEAIKHHDQESICVYGGTRAEYGPTTKLPVNEENPTKPKGVYEISALTAQQIFLFYGRTSKIKPICLRLTNLYGPRSQMKHNRTGVANWLIRELLVRKKVPIMGEGKILRDFLFVLDAVQAMLLCPLHPKTYHEILNVGNPSPTSFLQYAQSLINVAGFGEIEFIPMSNERKQQEPGDYYSDISKINQLTNWKPHTSLNEGLQTTLSFYQSHRVHYL